VMMAMVMGRLNNRMEVRWDIEEQLLEIDIEIATIWQGWHRNIFNR